MITASTGVQADLSQVVHFSCRSICHSPRPQNSTVHISCPRPKCLGHRCSEHNLVGSQCLCLPSHGSPSQGYSYTHFLSKQTILPCYRQADQQPWAWSKSKHDIRAFAASKAFYAGLSVGQSCKRVTGKLTHIFYLKDLTRADNNNNMYLGPVVAAKQVLDPSPWHTHLREEKKGGTPAAAESSGVYPRVPVLVTSQDVYSKVTYILTV